MICSYVKSQALRKQKRNVDLFSLFSVDLPVHIHLSSSAYSVWDAAKKFKRESDLFLTTMLTLWRGGHIAYHVGGELLYLWIWCDHLT